MTGGLASQGQRGMIDRFRHRLIWPIADVGGEIIGFGGRRLSDDKNSPKYLNTPETPLYKKSSVLYGLDLARREIVSQQKAIVVEGYTDVMACHLAGEGTAIATCGTSFGEEHIKILRRLTGDRNEYLGIKITFAFDGDAAGQKAALRVFEANDRFVMQTYVASQPDGLDPCDLRMARGDAAVRDLVTSSVSLAEFVIRTKLANHDRDSSEGRVRALRDAAQIVAGVGDAPQRDQYTRDLAMWLGMELNVVESEVRRAAPRRDRAAASAAPQQRREPQAPAVEVPARDRYRQREALKIALQYPVAAGALFDDLELNEFTLPGHALVWQAIAAAGGCSAARSADEFREKVMAAAADDRVRGMINELLVEPLQVRRTVKARDQVEQHYVETCMSSVRLSAVERRISLLRAQMLRAGAAGDPDAQASLFGQLQQYQQYAAQLKSRYGL
jgi:DNA primase